MAVEIDLREEPVPVVVAGLGVIGRQHARLLAELPSFRLVGACDANPEVRAEVGAHYDIPVVASYDELLALNPAAVVNALPTSLHFESTLKFLGADLHVLVEKPIASRPEEGLELARVASTAGLTLLVGHVERFNAGVLALKQQIESGRLGTIISAVSRRVGVARPAIPHANVALDLAIHDVDILRFLLGEAGELVACSGSHLHGNQMEDHVDLVLRYGAAFCTVQANWITPVKIRRLSITGSKGIAELDYITQQLRVYESVPAVIKGKTWDFFAVSAESQPIDIFVQKSEPLRAELQHFASCITQNVEPAVPAAEACAALDLVASASAQFELTASS